MSLNMEQPFTTGAVEEQILFGDPVTPSVEESKQQSSLLETPPSVNPSLSPAFGSIKLSERIAGDLHRGR